MAKIAMLLPHPDMLEPAAYAAGLYQLDVSTMAVLEYRASERVVSSVLNSDTDIIIARGGQAFHIRQRTSLPVIEIKLTTYEICLLIEEAKKLSEKEIPFIALTGPDNMFVNMDPAVFEERYSIRFRPYLFQGTSNMTETARMAIDDGADVLIGGPDVEAYCQAFHFPCLRTFSGPESIIEACRVAKAVSNALDTEKKQAASLNMLLNHASGGVIQTDVRGHILRVNQFVEHLLYLEMASIKDRPVWEFIPSISEKRLRMVMDKRKELRSTPIKYGRFVFIVSIYPVIADGISSGTIISFHEGRRISRLEAQLQDKSLRQGHVASFTFDTMIARNSLTQKLCEQARHFSTFQFPILILGPSGSEKHLFAECIHNHSTYKDKPFIRFNCNGYSQEDTSQLLFGNPVAEGLEESPMGLLYRGPCTVYLHEISNLSLQAQYQLLSYIQGYGSLSMADSAPRQNLARLIISSSCDLLKLVEKGLFRRDLYYAVSIAILKIPPLKERREDIMGWVDYHMGELQGHYGRYVKLTKDAQRFLQSYDWPGNLLELQTLCSRLLINCLKYSLDSRDVEEQMDCCLSDPNEESGRASLPRQTADETAARLIRALHKYEGNRESAAAELKISTTTLWRWMKKYRIPKDEGKL